MPTRLSKETIKKIYEKAMEFALLKKEKRADVYGDSWLNFGSNQLIAIASIKLWRILFIQDKESRKDDLLDALNYLVFAIALEFNLTDT